MISEAGKYSWAGGNFEIFDDDVGHIEYRCEHRELELGLPTVCEIPARD